MGISKNVSNPNNYGAAVISILCVLCILRCNGVPIYNQEEYNTFSNKGDISTLRLLHVLFRHGDRTPDADTLYPKDPYKNDPFEPVGLGQLTAKGQRQAYDIGKILRRKYSRFLGDEYTPGILDARSTDFIRTQLTLEFLLLGLFPSLVEKWQKYFSLKPLIPYSHPPLPEDQILGDPSVACPKFREELQKSIQLKWQLGEYNDLTNFFDYVSNNTGLNVTSSRELYNLFFALKSEDELGYELPAWTRPVWPEKITNGAILDYSLQTNSTEFKRLTGGYLMRKIVEDSRLVRFLPDKKLHLYSGHENNIAYLLIIMDIFYPHVPPYASYLIIEVHEIDGIYGFKVLYQDYTQSETEPRVLKMPGCDIVCPFDKFHELVSDYLPSSNDECEIE